MKEHIEFVNKQLINLSDYCNWLYHNLSTPVVFEITCNVEERVNWSVFNVDIVGYDKEGFYWLDEFKDKEYIKFQDLSLEDKIYLLEEYENNRHQGI